MSPIIKSAKKAFRQSKKRNVLNIRTKNKMKKIVKGLRVFVEEKKIEDAKKILPKAYKAVDKAAKRGVIKKNTASRKKSRLTKAVNKISSK
jgi:small subunit ribosomal protein S20